MYERLMECLSVALAYHVSDIHFTARDEQILIEMRVEGIMKQLKPDARDMALLRYLMYRANLDLADSLAPQTGSFEESVAGRKVSLRFAVVTSGHMTNGVLRILNSPPTLSVSTLSTQPDILASFAEIGKLKDGLVLFCGPTGSGKTTTLYTILNEISGKKIFTLEDPVEVVQERYVQLQINEKRGFSYAEGIRQLMRHDPDIIMIGEIRDPLAAAMAVRCALTGHLVVSSLHAGSCAAAVHRMKDLGVAAYDLLATIRLLYAQRLFAMPQGGKTGIYELMNEKEVAYYHETNRFPDGFIALSERIRQAEEAGQILAEGTKAAG